MTSPLDALLGWCENGDTPSTTFDIGSGQKSITSFVVGILIARGELDLEAPVSRWLGAGWTAVSADDERAIPLRHLLTMKNGLRDDFTAESPPGETCSTRSAWTRALGSIAPGCATPRGGHSPASTPPHTTSADSGR